MTIPLLPDGPTSSMSRAAFIAAADAIVAALNPWGAAVNATAAAFSVTMWLAATVYAVGDRVWSPLDFRGYRRVTVGASATDPSADSVNWARIEYTPKASTTLENIAIVPSVAGSALTIAIKTAAGASNPSSSDPIYVGMRHATLTNGSFNLRTITAALSLVISSGSTLGHTSAAASDIYVYLIDNAGTLELAASTLFYGYAGVQSTTAEGAAGAADSANALYSTAARSNVAFRCIGKMLSTQVTAGTWAAVPTDVQAGVLKNNPQPVVTVYTSGTAATHTTGPGTVQIEAWGKGAGGGGAGGGDASGGAGGTGGDSIFNSVNAKGGAGATFAFGGAGIGGTSGTGTATLRTPGASGHMGIPFAFSTTNMITAGGPGGGKGGGRGNNGAGAPGIANSGGGGAGGSMSNMAIGNYGFGCGGGEGEEIVLIIDNPGASFTYTVGAAGTAGVAGTNGTAGAVGGTGKLVIKERR